MHLLDDPLTMLLRFSMLALLSIALTAPRCRADELLRVQINQAIQPFSLPRQNSGLLVDIIQQAYASQGVSTHFVFMPAARSQMAYSNNEVDIITNAKHDGTNMVYTHWPVLTFKNVAISLKKKKFKIDTVADLAGLRIITFQHASQFLGAEFAAMAAHNKSYTELAFMPARMLNVDHADVVISQADIFSYNQINENTSAPMLDLDEYSYHSIFGKGNEYWLGFRSELMRDQFERGMATIYENGVIEQIFARYQATYLTSREMFITLDCHFLSKNKPKSCPK